MLLRFALNRGGAQASRLGPLLVSYQRGDAIASLAALAAADALAGAGRTLGRRTSRTGTGIGTLRVLATAAATGAAVGTAALAGVQRAIPVLGAATRAART